MEVGKQFYAPAILIPGKQTLVQTLASHYTEWAMPIHETWYVAGVSRMCV
jgi:hypothetical protein